MDNRKFLYIAVGGFLVFVIIVIILALGGREKTPEEVNLTFWNLEEDQSLYDDIIANFQAANPTVKINYVKKNPNEYLNNVLTDIAAGGGPDILAMPHDWYPKYSNLLNPMPDAYMEDKVQKKSAVDVYKSTFAPVAASDNIIDNKIYGVPLAIDTMQLYLNDTITEEAVKEYRAKNEEINETLARAIRNGPQTWEDLASIARLISRKSGSQITRSAVALGRADNVNNATDILNLLMIQNGAQMVSDDKTAALFHTAQNTIPQFANSEFPGTRALAYYTSFGSADNDNYSWDASMPDSVRAFAEGKTAMLIDYKSTEKEIKRISPNLSFQTLDIPQVKEAPTPINYASYNSFSVNRNSKNANAAWSFILYLTNKENNEDYFDQTKNTSALLSKLSEDSPVLQAQSWYKPDPTKANQSFSDAISQVLAGQTPQTAIDGAASQITNLLLDLKQ